MQVSWIDPEEIRRLVAQLAGPEIAPDSSAWELHTQPIAKPNTQVHGRLLDALDAAAVSAHAIQPEPSHIDEVHSAPGPQSAELWRIRERLRRLREKAQQAGILTPGTEAVITAVVAAPATPDDAFAETPAPSLEVPAEVPSEAPAVEPVAAPSPVIEAQAFDPTPASQPEPYVAPLSAESIVWATREDAPVAHDSDPATEVEVPNLAQPSADRLGSLAPLLAQAAAALAAHAQAKTQRPSPDPIPSASSDAPEPEPSASPALPSRLTLRSPAPSLGFNEKLDDPTVSPPAPARLSLRVPPHLVGREKQAAPVEASNPWPTPPAAEPQAAVQASASAENEPSAMASSVEPLFGPLVRPAFQANPLPPAPAYEAGNDVAAEITEASSLDIEATEPAPLDAAAEPIPQPVDLPHYASPFSALEDFVDSPGSDETLPVERPVATTIASAAISEPATANNMAPEAAPIVAPPCAEDFSPETVAPDSEVASEEPAPACESAALSATPNLEPTVRHSPDHPPSTTTPSTSSLPPLLPFTVPALGLSERLASLAEWACKGLATDEVLLVDDYGDVLWGGQGQTALVLSAMMAWHSAQRSAPASAVAQQRRIDKELACGRHLTVIPARTRYGVVSLAAIRQQRITELDANRIHDALMMSVEATGLNRIA